MLDPGTKPLALGAIVLAHVVAICILERCLVPARTIRPTEVSPLIITFVQDTAPKTRRVEAPARAPLEGQKKLTVEAPVISRNEATTGAIRDWEGEAHAAARDTVRRETDGAVIREFSHRFPLPAAPDAPGVFGLEKENHRKGVVEGGEVFWVTDDCYYDFPRAALLSHAAGEFHLMTLDCKPPPTGGGTDMFKELTPKYLTSEPGTLWHTPTR
jgi:hypothetical protein